MAKKDKLYELIHSLDKSEKRYFKLLITRDHKEHKHFELYTALEKAKAYDEKKIKASFYDN